MFSTKYEMMVGISYTCQIEIRSIPQAYPVLVCTKDPLCLGHYTCIPNTRNGAYKHVSRTAVALMYLFTYCTSFRPGLSALVHPETDSVDVGSSEDSLLGRRRSTPETDRHRHSEGRLPALPSAGQRARKEVLREIDEVSKKANTCFHVRRCGDIYLCEVVRYPTVVDRTPWCAVPCDALFFQV